MATFKIETIYDNTIWLTEVRSVETLVYAYANEFPEDFTAWQVLQGSIDKMHCENLREDIRYIMTCFINIDKAVGTNKLGGPRALVFVKVEFQVGEPELWLLQKGCNYLMVDGKTVDRI